MRVVPCGLLCIVGLGYEVVIIGRADARVRAQAMQAGAVEVLSTSFGHEVLLEKVRAALKS